MTRDLSLGCQGSDVTTLQKNLRTLGYYSGTIDGDFGPMTDSAVRAYQRANGLYVDGVVGPITRASIQGKMQSRQEEPQVNAAELIKSARKALQAGNGSLEVARWSNHKWIISSHEIRSIRDIHITGSSDVEKSDDNDQGYYSYKGSNPTEVTMTAILNAHTGNDVRKEVESFIMDAKKGVNDYIYVGYKKLFSCTMILTNASAKKIELAPNTTWVSAEVSLTFMQGSSDGLGGARSASSDSSGGSPGDSSGEGSGGGGGGSGGGGSYGGDSYSGSNKVTIKKSGTPLSAKTSTAPGVMAAAQINKGLGHNSGLQYQLNQLSAKKTTTTKVSTSKSRMTGQQR